MFGAFTPDMGTDEDRAAWLDARPGGMHRFVERRMLGFGLKLGLVLAAWNAVAGGTFMNYDVRRLLLEGSYYLLGGLVLSGLGAMLEWRYLERTFSRARVRARR